jgi:hypothetical protein
MVLTNGEVLAAGCFFADEVRNAFGLALLVTTTGTERNCKDWREEAPLTPGLGFAWLTHRFEQAREWTVIVTSFKSRVSATDVFHRLKNPHNPGRVGVAAQLPIQPLLVRLMSGSFHNLSDPIFQQHHAWTLFLLVSLFGTEEVPSVPSGPTPWSKEAVVPRNPVFVAANDERHDHREISQRWGSYRRGSSLFLTMRDYRKFALPCLALWVIGPMLSLIDTAFVGLSGDAALSAGQIAALGPATTFFDGATYLFAFLNVASTNLYSSARAQYGETSTQAESVVRTAARSALVSGFCVMGLLLAFARPLLGLYIGE